MNSPVLCICMCIYILVINVLKDSGHNLSNRDQQPSVVCSLKASIIRVYLDCIVLE